MQFLYHDLCLPSIAVRFVANALLNSLDDTVAATQEALSDEHANPSHGSVVVSALTVTGDDKGD